MKDLHKLLLISVALTLILTIVVFTTTSNPTTSNENFNEYKLTTPNKLTEGYYIITNRNNNTEKCLMSDNASSPYLYQNSDRLCGYNNLNDLIAEGKAVWYLKNIKDDIYIIASGYDNLNKCLIFGNNGKNNYLSKFSWGYNNEYMCGISGGNIENFNNSIGRSLFKINNIGDNKYVIINTSNFNTNNVDNIWPNQGSPSEATSTTLLSDDINSMSPYYINRNKTIAQPYCLGIADDNKPQRLVSYDNPDNKNACGFNSFNELINDGKMVWFFYKIQK